MNSEKQMDIAWGCILSQHIDVVSKSYDVYGPGLAIFKFIHKDNQIKGAKINCTFGYTGIKEQLFNLMLDLNPDKEKIKAKYASKSNFMVAIHIPLNSKSASNGQETIGSLKIFDKKTMEEIPYLVSD